VEEQEVLDKGRQPCERAGAWWKWCYSKYFTNTNSLKMLVVVVEVKRRRYKLVRKVQLKEEQVVGEQVGWPRPVPGTSGTANTGGGSGGGFPSGGAGGSGIVIIRYKFQ
jgi:uncharacterized membrane protein YgcG